MLAVARAHVGEKYVLGQRVPMIDETWRGPWDCAEFASWSVYQATGTLYGTRPIDDPIRADAYTGYWGEQARADGAVVSVELAARTPGALVLRLPVGDRGGHIVISDGLGGTIEAHSAARGVVADTVQKRRWDFGILVPGLQYFSNDEPVAVQPAPDSILRVTNPMMRGARVRAVQLALTKLGFAPGPVDGIYGPQVASAVQDFQASRQLVPDGEVGPTTRRALGIR